MITIDKITKEQQQTSHWAGGTTTQIAIYPQGASYTNRDFFWRLSTAVVELEESSFTKLPGFDRHLMVLEGELELLHHEQHSIILRQYEQDRFKGAWDTVSLGRARDFNLMLKEGLKGKLAHYRAAEGESIKIELVAENLSFFACYCNKGEISIKAAEQKAALAEGDLVLIRYMEDLNVIVDNNGKNEASLIAAFIEV
jgi:environmental stress-induced protein Ves